MLFPEEIFKMILKKHKIICLEEKLNFNGRICRYVYLYRCYKYTTKNLRITIYESPQPTIISYIWKKGYSCTWLASF